MTGGSWLVVGAVLAVVAAMLVGADVVGRTYDLRPEVRRKLLHFGSGFLGLGLPWLFEDFAPVAVICGVAFVALLVIRLYRPLRQGIGESIHGVDRHTLGDFVVPVATASLFLLADGDRLLYVVPMLLLTLADASAALVAIRYGLSPYPTLDGKKTWEGTAVFLAVASWAVLVPLLLYSDIGRREVLLVTLLVAFLSALIEASSWSGLDNLFIPWGSFFLLRRAIAMDASALVTELIVLVVLAVIVFVGAPRSRLTVQARFCLLLLIFVVWALVGWRWVAPAVMVVALHPVLVPIPRQAPERVDLRAVITAATSTVWAILEQLGMWTLDRNLYAFSVCLAVHLALTADVRLRSAYPPTARPRPLTWSLVSTISVCGWYVAQAGFSQRGFLLLILALPVVLASGYLFWLIPVRRLTTRCYVLQAYLGLQASAVAFVIHSLVSELP